MDNLIKFTQSQVFKTFRALVIIAFGLGGWFTTLQLKQLDLNDRTAKNESEIVILKHDLNDVKMNTFKDITEMKGMLEKMSIYFESSKEDIKELKNK